jgi:MinD superfamily P-loop ATPase
MKELLVISGKGGTGKTSVTAAFASLATNMVLCDADVDAADLHLLMNPTPLETHDFKGGGLAVIDPEKCVGCDLCRDLCRFDAISEDFIVDAISCEGCGVCVDLCPENAIGFPQQTCGEWYISEAKFGPMVHARLGIAQENSGRLVALIRKQATELAEQQKRDLIITDGPPGVGCPVIASLSGVTAVILIAEPTVSGFHDIKRVAELASHFKIPGMLCVNKYDLNLEKTIEIEAFAKEKNIVVLGRISFNSIFTKAMIQGKNVFEYDENSEVCTQLRIIWETVMKSEPMNNMGIIDFRKTIK